MGIPNFTTEMLKTPEGLSELNRIFNLLNDNVVGNTTNVRVFNGFGSPEGVIAAGVGSLYQRFDGSVGSTIYMKESGTLATGWVAIAQIGTPVSLADGGTGAILVDPNADRIFFWDDSETSTAFLTLGTGLLITGTTLNSVNTSNVIFAWSGTDVVLAASNGYGMHGGTDLNVANAANAELEFMICANTTFRTLKHFKFRKIAGISTITIHARLWSAVAGASDEAELNVDIGGQSNTVKSVTSSSPGWVTSSDIDVSGLSDGTTYDGIIQLRSESNASSSMCSAVTLIGS